MKPLARASERRRPAQAGEAEWPQPRQKPRIGIVLGSGVARGWAHIGVLQALARLGIRPDVVCGCSSGALVGASYAAGRLETLNELANAMTFSRTLGFLDLRFARGGLIEGRWIVDFCRRHIGDIRIEDAACTFGAVATELGSGRETWLTSGSLIDAVRASLALPGLLTPVPLRGQWLVDGALVNPLPVSLCRALGADVIIGVNLSGDLVTRNGIVTRRKPRTRLMSSARSAWLGRLRKRAEPPEPGGAAEPAETIPTYLEVLAGSFLVMENFVSRVRLAADPVDVLVTPEVRHLGVMDFHRAEEAIAAGEAAVAASRDQILAACRTAAAEAPPVPREQAGPQKA
ncbi:patatin-like phospholipase RssA [Propylenella binzhouense]|uniref:Patatin-like phospholipase RssA n=1 Tax=Propylenella binzhouense TaxID=2555902 RepID=A0A964T7W9_9HYPH|nr:patatin-like phospholipase RssA [Propylenella binzhouense]MYZ50100.1 patatin-like phospholipase RssA [Propylenella binzhouense]